MKAFTTAYKGPTDRQGTRIVVRGTHNRMRMGWDWSLSEEENHKRAAEAFARSAFGGCPQIVGGRLEGGKWAWVVIS